MTEQTTQPPEQLPLTQEAQPSQPEANLPVQNLSQPVSQPQPAQSQPPVKHLPRLRAFEVTFGNGETMLVHEPRSRDMAIVLRAMPAVKAMGVAFDAFQSANEGIAGVPIDLPGGTIESLHPLFAAMCDLPVSDFEDLSIWDSMALVTAFGALTPKNQTAATPTTQAAS